MGTTESNGIGYNRKIEMCNSVFNYIMTNMTDTPWNYLNKYSKKLAEIQEFTLYKEERRENEINQRI